MFSTSSSSPAGRAAITRRLVSAASATRESRAREECRPSESPGRGERALRHGDARMAVAITEAAWRVAHARDRDRTAADTTARNWGTTDLSLGRVVEQRATAHAARRQDRVHMVARFSGALSWRAHRVCLESHSCPAASVAADRRSATECSVASSQRGRGVSSAGDSYR